MDALPSYQDLAKMSNKDLTDLFGIRDFFTYEIDFSAFATTTTPSGSFTVQADSNFVWQYGAMLVDANSDLTTANVIPMVSCNIIDTGSGRQLMSSNVPVSSLFGNGQLPFLLPTPRFFRAQTTVQMQLLNFSSATTYRIKFSFIGTKLFKFAQSL